MDNKMRILFTAVGGSDPIKRQLDGPMLHCCRMYKPDIVYMYFTKKMLEYEQKDKRYTWCLEKLGEKLGHEFTVIPIERADLVEVQLYDNYFDDFTNILNRISNEHPDAEIYLNASSGTPAIKNAMFITAALAEKKFTVLQVSSGADKPLHDRDKDETYDKYEQWECNLDNETPVDRVTVVKSANFLAKIEKQNIRRLVKAYDYSAAADIASRIKEHLDESTIKTLNAAAARLRLDYNGVIKELKNTDIDIIPVKNDEKRSITEYLLWLGVTLKKGDYLSFIRGITPAAMRLMEEGVEKFTPVGNIKDYCINRNGHFILTAEVMAKTKTGQSMLDILSEEFALRGGLRNVEYSTAQLAPLICAFCVDEKINKYIKIIRTAESELRNPAAHEVVAVDDAFIKRKINITSGELYSIIQKLAERVGIADKRVWSSYDDMNKKILEMLGT